MRQAFLDTTKMRLTTQGKASKLEMGQVARCHSTTQTCINTSTIVKWTSSPEKRHSDMHQLVPLHSLSSSVTSTPLWPTCTRPNRSPECAKPVRSRPTSSSRSRLPSSRHPPRQLLNSNTTTNTCPNPALSPPLRPHGSSSISSVTLCFASIPHHSLRPLLLGLLVLFGALTTVIGSDEFEKSNNVK